MFQTFLKYAAFAAGRMLFVQSILLVKAGPSHPMPLTRAFQDDFTRDLQIARVGSSGLRLPNNASDTLRYTIQPLHTPPRAFLPRSSARRGHRLLVPGCGLREGAGREHGEQERESNALGQPRDSYRSHESHPPLLWHEPRLTLAPALSYHIRERLRAKTRQNVREPARRLRLGRQGWSVRFAVADVGNLC